ncbi:hypothetical protein [Domibacillus mangrovi]|nr:hypothetical protein [Domibacillus mangrovi]
MHWLRLIPIAFFSLSALSLLLFQVEGIIHSVQEYMTFYKQK